jgi:DNA (cytosine-5)-methyltransferase 1
MEITHASVFTGIGGFDLAANWIGWKNIFQVEKDNFCTKVLEKNFPDVKRYKEIEKFHANEYEGTIDIISGGFPCQPFSVAGKRKGRSDSRYLWKEFNRIISECKPRFAVCENVPGIISLENGSIFSEILFDLANEGYFTETFTIPACSVGAFHKRERLFIIAYGGGFRSQKNFINPKLYYEKPEISQFRNRSLLSLQLQNGSLQNGSRNCGKGNGIPETMDRIKALGNAVVPQVAFEIFLAINYFIKSNGI